MHTDYVDIPQPFTQGELPDGDGQIGKVYISDQPGYPEDPDYCYLLVRSLYDMPSTFHTRFTTMSKFLKTDAEFFKADSRVAFLHKCNQDSTVPEPIRQEYIIHYQRICSGSVVTRERGPGAHAPFGALRDRPTNNEPQVQPSSWSTRPFRHR